MGKIHNLTLKEKYEVIKLHKNNTSIADICAKYKCGKTQAYNIVKNGVEISARYIEGTENTLMCRKRKENNFRQVDDVIIEWLAVARAKSFPISGPILQEKAREVAKKLGLNDFKASNGWLRCFRQRNNIKFKTCSGEASEVNQDVVIEWRSRLNALTEGYSAKDIANCDETGLYYRMLPNKTLHFQGQKCVGGKFSKERLTILLTVFADGTIYKTTVIGKNLKPRCFKNLNIKSLPVNWHANTKAWMTSRLFESYLIKLNLEMEKQKRQILLFLDNATSHPEIFMPNVKLVYFPANTTAVLQPLDNGIIQNVKLNYKKLMLKSILLNMDRCEKASELTKTINVLDSIMFLKEAINSLKAETIVKCFRNCGFLADSANEIAFEVSQELNDIDDLINDIYGDDTCTARNFLEIDNNLPTENDTDDLDVLVQLSDNISESYSSDEDEVQTVETQPIIPTLKDILTSISTIKSYASNAGYTDIYEDAEKINVNLIKSIKRNKVTKQISLDEYFKPTNNPTN